MNYVAGLPQVYINIKMSSFFVSIHFMIDFFFVAWWKKTAYEVMRRIVVNSQPCFLFFNRPCACVVGEGINDTTFFSGGGGGRVTQYNKSTSGMQPRRLRRAPLSARFCSALGCVQRNKPLGTTEYYNNNKLK